MNCSIFKKHKNKTCSVFNKKLGEDNSKKDWSICKNCYNEKKRKNNIDTLIQNQQLKIDNVNNNNRTLLIGPSFSGKTYLMLKTLSRIPDQDIYIITKSPPEQ